MLPVRASVLLLCLLMTAGCATPFLVFPGEALQGEVTSGPIDAGDHGLLQLEVNPDDPYSVILRVTEIEGAIYIDASPRRRWATYMAENPAVRVKLGDDIYEVFARPVDDPVITERFLPGRTIYRLEARP